MTQKLREWAAEQLRERHELWETGTYKANSSDLYQFVSNDSLAHGECQVLRRIELLDFEDILGDQADVSSPSTGPNGV